MNKINLFLLVICIVLFLFVGCNDKQAFIIRMENETENEINILSFSRHGEIIQTPVISLEPYSKLEVCFDSLTSGININFAYRGKKYKINTGYADDYRSYTIRFTESNTLFECLFIANGGFTGDDVRILDITEMEDYF